jgi:hypothetical protein
MAFRFIQQLSDFLQPLSAFFNGFLTFFNGFLIFLNGLPLSEKSKKIYLRRQVYKRSLFELRISTAPLASQASQYPLQYPTGWLRQLRKDMGPKPLKGGSQGQGTVP